MHQYILKSRGKEYALITVTSHALNTQDVPLLYFGEELKGMVFLSLNDAMGDMQSMDVVVSQFYSLAVPQLSLVFAVADVRFQLYQSIIRG
jgi:hypothetical protein